MAEAKVTLAALAVAALLIGLVIGYYVVPPKTVTKTILSIETLKTTETARVTETRVVSSEVTKTLRVTETVSAPTTVVRKVTYVVETTKLLRPEAACINGWCPMPPGYLYLIRGVDLGKPQPPKGLAPIIIPEDAEVVELKPKCCLHGLPYVRLPELKNETAALLWRAVIYPLENTSVGHMVWILPAEGEVLNIRGDFISGAFPYERPPKGDVKVIFYNLMDSIFGRFADKSTVLRDMRDFHEKTLEYLNFAKGMLSRYDYINGELCVMNPYCLCCLNKEFFLGSTFGKLENISAGQTPIKTTDPIELLKAVKEGMQTRGYSCAMVSAVSVAPIYLNYTSDPIIAVAGMIVSGEPT